MRLAALSSATGKIGAAFIGLVLALGFVPGAFAASSLVTPQWVQERLDDPSVVLLDVRSRRSYSRGHILGAFQTDLARSGWLKTIDNGPPSLPSLQDLANVISRHGISNDSHVVLIPVGSRPMDMAVATTIYWLLKYAGHEDVSILDGGMRAYRAAVDAPLSDDTSEPKPQPYRAVRQADVLATSEDAMSALGVGGLIDHRPPADFVGLNKAAFVRRPGSIPGAKNVPAEWLMRDGRGSFRAADDMRRIFNYVGVATDKVTISFGNSSLLGSLGWFVSHEIMGNENARLYFGSMGEWAADEQKPVVTRLDLG